MHMILQRRIDFNMERLANVLAWLTKGGWQIVPGQTVDELQAEILHLEKTLANAPTRPMRTRNFKPLEPISERQKIMDLAG
jgi:hypothetical protein